MTKEEIARDIYGKVKAKQLKSIQERMPDEKQGVEIEINGVKYISFIRRLTPAECDRLQGIPDWYNWGGCQQHNNIEWTAMDGSVTR